jgi:hypothetical protein
MVLVGSALAVPVGVLLPSGDFPLPLTATAEGDHRSKALTKFFATASRLDTLADGEVWSEEAGD